MKISMQVLRAELAATHARIAELEAERAVLAAELERLRDTYVRAAAKPR